MYSSVLDLVKVKLCALAYNFINDITQLKMSCNFSASHSQRETFTYGVEMYVCWHNLSSIFKGSEHKKRECWNDLHPTPQGQPIICGVKIHICGLKLIFYVLHPTKKWQPFICGVNIHIWGLTF